jgi:small-conductance mechanosensitive channel
LKAGQRSAHRLQADLDERLEPASNSDYLGPLLEWASSAWSYELASVDDRPITIGKIVLLVVYCGMGLIVARIVGRVTARRLLPRFGLNEGAIHAIHSILFYSLSIMFGLLSLEVVHLPFAAFTFLGGAAAIGIGFGSQNILNNFISGLILLAEQPIRVGDLVEIDSVQGTVEHIGPRSTRVRTASNHELIVPNSKLLENRVVNLTLSDDLVQTCLGISIVPTMPLDEARRLLRCCASSHSKVLPSPEPIVLLREFSSTAVVFELHFWLRMNSVMECRIVESEIRETICEVFRGASPKSVSRDGKLENAAAVQQRLAG